VHVHVWVNVCVSATCIHGCVGVCECV